MVLMLIVIAGGCGLNKEKLLQEGYQVLEKYSIAIKLPCDLQVDKTAANDSTIGEYVVMVCPQIFKDTSRTSFYLEKLIGSGNVVYHLNILTNSTLTPIEMLVDRQKQILQLLNVHEFEEIDVEGKKH
jgi:hypothetical protein